ncbi:MAG: hypothetical protein HY422_03060 [Candidatus Komeilibacteria bacterium]|nr:hypothetical protein [Candidatus Komeilibacteria bacterium]
MQICIAIVLSVVATLSLAAAADGEPDHGTKPSLLQIAETSIDFSADSSMFLPEYETEQKYLIDAQDVKAWKGYKWVVFAYWGIAAFKSYGRDGEIKFNKSYLGDEPSVNASFQTADGNRAIFVPRSRSPVILFPLGNNRNRRFDRILVMQLGNGGGVFYCALALGPPKLRHR